jgi:hypothetical protein
VPGSVASTSAVADAPAVEASPRTPRVADPLELLVLVAVIAAQLLPLVLLPYVPTQDGPSHQALTYALRVYDQPAGAPLRQYLERNSEALPNWFVFFLQAKVLAFVSVAAAEKVLIAAYVVLLPLGLRYALRAVDRDAGFLAALGLPFTYNFLFGMGFLNFCWSLAAFCFAFGFYLWRRERFRARDVLPLALLSAWVYVCHPVTLVMLLLAVGTFGLGQALLEVRKPASLDSGAERAIGWWRAGRERLFLPLLSFAPVLALLVAFLGRRLERRTSHLDLTVKVKHLLALYSLVSFDRRLLLVSCGVAALLAALAGVLLWKRWRQDGLRPSADDALLVVAVVCALVYFVAPSELAGGGFVNHRLALFAPLALLLWLASTRWGARARWATQAAGATLAVSMLALLWTRWAKIDHYLAEYVEVADRVEDGSIVLPLALAPAGLAIAPDGSRRELAFRVWPFVHALGYVAGRRPIVDLGLYEAAEDYFPLRYRAELDPYRHLSIGPVGVEQVPPRIDIWAYLRRGGRVDYVLLWQPQAAPPDHALTRDLRRQLDAGFARVQVSASGNAELWRRTDDSTPAPPR